MPTVRWLAEVRDIAEGQGRTCPQEPFKPHSRGKVPEKYHAHLHLGTLSSSSLALWVLRLLQRCSAPLPHLSHALAYALFQNRDVSIPSLCPWLLGAEGQLVTS